jgi:CubicO group peptidase (beta-lactamase class C family)
MTAIAALQCVERGQLALDDDISAVLPEFKEPEIVVGVEETTKKPILEKAGGHITLRMLLTHQSGLGYRFLNPEYDRYAEYHKLPSSGTVVSWRCFVFHSSFCEQTLSFEAKAIVVLAV